MGACGVVRRMDTRPAYAAKSKDKRRHPLSHSVPGESETRGQGGNKALWLLLKVIEGPGLLLL